MSQDLLKQLETGEAKFADVLAFIDARYQHVATAFKNGLQHNAATENQGSAKVLTFAKIQGLNPAQTLSLFAEHYQSVLATPAATDTIRQRSSSFFLPLNYKYTSAAASSFISAVVNAL